MHFFLVRPDSPDLDLVSTLSIIPVDLSLPSQCGPSKCCPCRSMLPIPNGRSPTDGNTTLLFWALEEWGKVV